MDRDTKDSMLRTILAVFMGGAAFILAYLSVGPSAADGWYDALCEGEVISVEAGAACLVDGKVEMLEEYNN
jgi:hypothetical protein